MGKFDNKTISIYGLGSIGFNIGQALLKKNEQLVVNGFDIKEEKITIAKESNAISNQMKSFSYCYCSSSTSCNWSRRITF